MDDWMFKWFTDAILFGFNGRSNGKTAAQQKAKDEARIKRETTREVTADGRFVRTTTLTEIQEGEFEEIEDTETGEIAVRELADQTADRGEEIFDHQADEG